MVNSTPVIPSSYKPHPRIAATCPDGQPWTAITWEVEASKVDSIGRQSYHHASLVLCARGVPMHYDVKAGTWMVRFGECSYPTTHPVGPIIPVVAASQ